MCAEQSSQEQWSQDMCKTVLEVEEPWKLTHMELDHQEQVWHLHLDFERGAWFACPLCSEPCKAYDSSQKKWSHLDFWDWKTLMHARMPRVKCTSCDKIIQVYGKWARPLSRFSLLFEAWVMHLMAEMPVNAAARELREHDTRMWRIFHYYVDQAMSELDMSSIKRIAIDETSSRRGHRYITLFVDVDRKIVLFATEGKGMDTLARFKEHLAEKGIAANQMEEICCDMSPAFIRGD